MESAGGGGVILGSNLDMTRDAAIEDALCESVEGAVKTPFHRGIPDKREKILTEVGKADWVAWNEERDKGSSLSN